MPDRATVLVYGMVGMLVFALAALLISLPALAADAPLEADIQARLCTAMRQEVNLGQLGRADCVSDTHAIEIDWSENWHEGLGQALSYAAATRLRLGLILLCRKSPDLCLSHSLGAQQTFSTSGVEATVWECQPEYEALAVCRRVEIAP